MLKIYHRQILREALQKRVSSQALRVIEEANVGQDALRGQIRHDEYHLGVFQILRIFTNTASP